jgi:hypothetical protein
MVDVCAIYGCQVEKILDQIETVILEPEARQEAEEFVIDQAHKLGCPIV